MRSPNYKIVEDTPEKLVIQDVGPWDSHPTITNAAEETVRQLAPGLGKRRLFYYDSEGQLDELVHEGGRFVRFAPGPRL